MNTQTRSRWLFLAPLAFTACSPGTIGGEFTNDEVPLDLGGAPLPEYDVDGEMEGENGCLTIIDTSEQTVESEVESFLSSLNSQGRTLYINRDGGRYTGGSNDSSRNVSSVVGSRAGQRDPVAAQRLRRGLG